MPKNHRWVNNNRYNISHLFLRFFTRKTFHKAFKHVESDIWDQFYIKNHANIPIDQTEMHKDMLMFGEWAKYVFLHRIHFTYVFKHVEFIPDLIFLIKVGLHILLIEKITFGWLNSYIMKKYNSVYHRSFKSSFLNCFIGCMVNFFCDPS